MSKKHIDEYYGKIRADYMTLLADLRELESEVANSAVDPEIIENVKKSLEPLKQNYERWTYMMYLFNMPNKPRKKPKYVKQNQNLLDNLDSRNSVESVLQENKTALEEVENHA